MKTEEKAKAYDEALKRAKAAIDIAADKDLVKGVATTIFPELKESESEDERMRQRIIKAIRLRADDMNEEWSDEIAWLEKQKAVENPKKGCPTYPLSVAEGLLLAKTPPAPIRFEQKQKTIAWSEEDENKLNHILEIVHIASGSEVSVDEKEELESFLKSLQPQPKQEWSEEDKAMIGCIVCCLDGQFVTEAARKQCLEWFNKHRRDFLNQPKQEWNEFDEGCLKRAIWYVENPAPSVVKDTNLVLWLKSLKDRGNFPKSNTNSPSEWSEEDKHRCKDAIYFLETAKKHYASTSEIELTIAWLKSLRPQPKKELSIEKAIKWLNDTFYFLDNSSGRGRDCEITTHDFDSLEEMYDSFRKAVIVDSEPHWKPTEEQKPEAKLTGWAMRGINEEVWVRLDRKSFPDLKDEPMEVEITIKKKNAEL